MAKAKKSYTPAPAVPPEQMQRLAKVVEVLAGLCTVSEAARALAMSRNHFQTILHRGVMGLTDAITPREAGRPAKPQAMAALEAQLTSLKRENTRLQERVGSTERLLQAASGLLQGRIRPTRRQVRAKKVPGAADEDKGEPEPEAERRRQLQGADEMRRLGLTAQVTARIAGVHEATLRRWRARARHGACLSQCRRGASAPAAQLVQRADEIVRGLNGLVGAESLRRSVVGLSRRQAARVKAQTLTDIERTRKAALTRVSLATPGVMRGMDAMHFKSADGALYALFAGDAAIPYRTGVTLGTRYDATLVARALASDIEVNGAPLVYRLDRASAHTAPAARELLAAHEVLVLQGPPRCARFYGQLERQNREHRAWASEIAQLRREEIEPCLKQMLEAVNSLWKRRTLHWRTASEAWHARECLRVDRRALREEVRERAARIARDLQCRGKPADLAERLAIEQALQARGYLRQEIGGWC